MASQGPNATGSVTEDTSFGASSWNDLSNATASDDTYAAFYGTGFLPQSYYFVATTFGFSIPGGSTIDGIEATFHRYADATSGDTRIRIVKGGVIGSTDRAIGTWPASETAETAGGASDLWGETWTPADINASDFGVALSVYSEFGGSYIDVVTITVHYTGGATYTPVNLTAGQEAAAFVCRQQARTAVAY